MAVLARPDLVGCLLTRLRSITEVTALVSSAAGWTDGRTEPRISGVRQDKWALPTRAIRLRRTGGPVVDEDYSLSIWTSRIDVLCYGQDERLAGGLMDLVLPALCVPQDQAASFTAAGCRVGSIRPEADAIVDLELDTRFPFAWCPLIVLWLGLPV